MNPTRPLPHTRNVTSREADSSIKRHAEKRKMSPRIYKLALYKDGLNTAEGQLHQDARRYFLSTPGRGT